MSEEEEERVDLATIQAEVEATIGDLLDTNARVMRACRSKANKLFVLADNMERMAEEYRRMASLHVLAAKEHALLLADTIDAEYDITQPGDDGYDDDEEEEEEDGEEDEDV